MPSRSKQVTNLGRRLVAWLAWLPFTGDVTHGRTYGDLKRLRPSEAVVLLIPLCCYAAFAAWVYVFFPREIIPLAASTYGAAILLAGTLMGTMSAFSRLADWRLARQSDR